MPTVLLCLMCAATAPDRAVGWIRPDADDAEPIWGIEGGTQVGLLPTGGGPRGLIRIFTPYLGNPKGQVINFIAVEPIVGGKRGYSELEHSQSDGEPGKRMWTTDEFPTEAQQTTPTTRPARGVVSTIDGTETLSFHIVVEPFECGARPVIQVILRSDRPHGVAFRTYTAHDGKSMEACILSATMGNYARLRRLQLKDQIVHPSELWPTFESKHPHGKGFTPHAQWEVSRLIVSDGWAEACVEPDEIDPEHADYAPETPPWWKYKGRLALQIWRARAEKDLVVRVNARRTYWGSSIDIPGGIAFENFEMQAPFAAGQEFIFGVEPK